MHAGMFLASVTLTVGLVVNAGAQQLDQQAQAAKFMTGVSPRDIKVVPIDVSKAMQPLNNVNRTFRTPRPPTPFTLSQFFPRVTLPSWPPKKAFTPILPKSPFETITTLPPPKKK
jgi:hypothetical protein